MVSHTELVIRDSEISPALFTVGPKSKAIAELKKSGFPIPPFVVLPSSLDLECWLSDEGDSRNIRDRLLRQILEYLPVSRFAVRSNALNEDGQTASKAGMFHSEIDVSSDGLTEAIQKVLLQATEVKKVSLQEFSLIVQEYIAADFSGVLFTRDPLGARELLIEFADGPCAPIVSGERNPGRFQCYHLQEECLADGRDFSDLVRMAEAIENQFAFPQDIEWCCRAGKYSILQSRPITTLSEGQVAAFRFLDTKFQQSGPKLFERNGISEIAPKPRPATFSLLQRLYQANGPVDRVYRKHRIRYSPRDFLSLLGNDLFSDLEEERRTIFPALRLNESGEFSMKLRSMRELATTLWNKVALHRISAKDENRLRQELKVRLSFKRPEKHTIEAALSHFLRDYEVIFEINLLAEIAVGRLASARLFVDKESATGVSELLQTKKDESFLPFLPSAGLLSNSLDFEDRSEFHSSWRNQSGSSIKNLSGEGWKGAYLESLRIVAARFSELREFGRWLVVLHIDRLRGLLEEIGRDARLEFPQDVIWFGLSELRNGSVSSDVAEERKKDFQRYQKFCFPHRVGTIISVVQEGSLLGVSPGIAEGELVFESHFAKDTEMMAVGEKRILYTPILSPHLVKFFPNVSGIVAEQGGMLSHLAILAREQGIPVVVRVRPDDSRVIGGRRLLINGTTGDIQLCMEGADCDKSPPLIS